jgi:hypothetical protein
VTPRMIAIVSAGLAILYVVTWFIAVPLLRKPHGRHMRTEPIAAGWDASEDDQTVGWLRAVRAMGSACGQAAELRVQRAVVDQILASARRARTAWRDNGRAALTERSGAGILASWQPAAIVRIPAPPDPVVTERRALIAARVEEGKARAAAGPRPWADETGTFAAIAAGDQP